LHDLEFLDDVLGFDEDVPFDADVEGFAKQLFGGFKCIGADAADVSAKCFIGIGFPLGLAKLLAAILQKYEQCGRLTVLEMAELKRSTTSGRWSSGFVRSKKTLEHSSTTKPARSYTLRISSTSKALKRSRMPR
jgi:hypothetical protein